MGSKRPCPSCETPLPLNASSCAQCGALLVVEPRDWVAAKDEEQLKFLSIAHYLVGGFMALGLLGLIAQIGLMLILVFIPSNNQGSTAASPGVGLAVAAIAAAFLLGGILAVVLVLLSGHFIAQRRRYGLCLTAAGFCCLLFPFGTALAIFSFVVLSRPSVKALFAAPPGP